jgi:hypothetical protein
MTEPRRQPSERPLSCKRVTFALGQDAQDQSDRLARILSTYVDGGVSRSAVVRGLLQLAESAALRSGDPIVGAVLNTSQAPKFGFLPEVEPADAEFGKLWAIFREAIFAATAT